MFPMSIKVCTKNYPLLFWYTFFQPIQVSPKIIFSSMLLLTCGSYALNIFRMDPFTSSFLAISLSDTLFTSRTLSARSSLTTILFHFFFHQLRCKMFASTSNVPCFTPFLFYAGCSFCRNPPHLTGLGTGIKKHRNVRPMVGL